MTPMRRRIPPQSGTGLKLAAGDLLVIIDPDGEQVADLTCFSDDDHTDGLSSGRTIDYNETLRLTTGNVLWSRRSRRLMTIVDDTCGVHDILLTPCSLEMFAILHGQQGHHPSCLENLVVGLRPFGVEERDIAATLNVFMNVAVDPAGPIAVLPPLSTPGTRTVLRAEIALVVGVTACSAEQSNNGSFKPIDLEVIPAQ
ncbi:MAG: urea carboxylase-associated family protein [Candidatus Dormibacteraeota bacterium]|uniref:Urea carboxylase-associated family protein n=1 Tax=Candidatus Amunia macphersoniae TaxID=3127014 RepID=A0A934KLX8_9BACT|nr:urea carboxylase-associated family protein [Candidatus Dormibacteraeota bacterium]